MEAPQHHRVARMPHRPTLVLVAVLVLTALATPAHAADHPLEATDAACYDDATTTLEMVECAGESYERWDRELNLQYKRLMDVLPPEGQQALRESQRKWIAFRDAEFAFIDSAYSQRQGTIYRPLHMEARTAIVKARAQQLTVQSYLLDSAL